MFNQRRSWCGGINSRNSNRRAVGRRAVARAAFEALEGRRLFAAGSEVGIADQVFNLSAGATGFVVTRDGDTTRDVVVDYVITDGTATQGDNYSASAGGSILIPSGHASATIPFSVLPANFAEPSRNFQVTLIGVSPSQMFTSLPASGANIGAAVGGTIADINRDGKPDMILTGPSLAGIHFLINTSSGGTPSFDNVGSMAIIGSPRNVLAMDFDGDEDVDLAISDWGGAVYILENRTSEGSIDFSLVQAISHESRPDTMVAVDWDGDGRLDIASSVDNGTAGTMTRLQIARNVTVGATIQFEAPVVHMLNDTDGRSLDLAIADIDGDGKPDAAMPHWISGKISVLINGSTGPGNFDVAEIVTLSGFVNGPRSLRLADLDGDGKPDLIAGVEDSVLLFRNVSVPGQAIFDAPQEISIYPVPVRLEVADFDRDDRVDIAVGHSNGQTTLLLNRSTGHGDLSISNPRPLTSSGSLTYAMKIGDFDLDGDIDIVQINETTGVHYILANNATDFLAYLGDNTVANATLMAAPAVTSINLTGNNVAAPAFTVTFSHAVTGVTAANFSVDGTTGGTVGTPTTADGGLTWSVPIIGASAGQISLGLTDNTGITDAHGNKLYTTLADDGSTFDPVYSQIGTLVAGLSVTLTSVTSPTTDQRQIPVTVTFSRAVTGFTADDLKVANGTIASFAGSGSVYTFTLVPKGPGNVSVRVMADSASDAEGNRNLASDIFTRTFAPVPVAGDYNYDGKVDLIIRDSLSGRNFVWFMDGNTRIGTAELPAVENINWSLSAMADFNRDGHSDLVFHNANSGATTIWFMSGTQRIGSTALPAIDTAWRLRGAGDFDGDGQADLVWHNSRSGAATVWHMNGPAMRTTGTYGALPKVADTSWTIAAVADFDGDGDPDLLWSNAVAQQSSLWLMNHRTVAAYRAMPHPAPVWNLLASADLDADGAADLLWRHTDGTTTLWHLANTAAGPVKTSFSKLTINA